MTELYANLKERVRAFRQANPCGVKFNDAEPGTRRFYELVEAHRYTKEWYIPFDVVYSHGVLHHTPDTARPIQEIHRVLRQGGRAVVMLYHRDSYNSREYFWASSCWSAPA